MFDSVLLRTIKWGIYSQKRWSSQIVVKWPYILPIFTQQYHFHISNTFWKSSLTHCLLTMFWCNSILNILYLFLFTIFNRCFVIWTSKAQLPCIHYCKILWITRDNSSDLRSAKAACIRNIFYFDRFKHSWFSFLIWFQLFFT